MTNHVSASRVRLRLLAGSLLVLAVSGCALLPRPDDGTPPADARAPVRIALVEGVYENIDPSFWVDGDPRRGYALFLNTWVYLDLDLQADAVPVEVRLYDFLGNFWTLSVDLASLSAGDPLGGWIRLRDHHMSDNGAMLPLRGMRLQAELDDGSTVSAPVAFPPPGASTADERFLVSEEYRGELTGEHAFALARAEIVAVDLDAERLRVVTGPVDRRATNGQVVLLAADRSLVGETEEFYNDVSREPRPLLNGGTRFRTSEENLVDVELAAVAWRSGRSPDDVRYVYVKLRDGGQFAFTEQSRSYLHLSRSALHPVRRSAP